MQVDFTVDKAIPSLYKQMCDKSWNDPRRYREYVVAFASAKFSKLLRPASKACLAEDEIWLYSEKATVSSTIVITSKTDFFEKVREIGRNFSGHWHKISESFNIRAWENVSDVVICSSNVLNRKSTIIHSCYHNNSPQEVQNVLRSGFEVFPWLIHSHVIEVKYDFLFAKEEPPEKARNIDWE